jgi:hypothetical protein
MVAKLPQALAQLSRLAEDFARDPGLYDDRGKDPDQTVAYVAAQLCDAIREARMLAGPLDRAASGLSHLGIGDD